LGLTFIVPETTTKPAPNQSKTNNTEEEAEGRRKKSCQRKSGKKIQSEENGISNRRIKSNFIPPLT
jgi:hypothetical protein